MGQPVQLVFFDECCFEEGEWPDFDNLIVVCPETGALIQAVNWHRKGVVNAATYDRIDLTTISRYYGVATTKEK